MSVVTPDNELEQKGLARWAQRSAEWTEKWFPDAYVFALAGAVLLAAAAMVNGSSPVTVVQVFGDGFWDLTAFTLQMAMVVLTGYVVATAGPVARVIDRVATVPKTGRGAVAFVALISCVLSLLNWGLSVVFSGLLARAIARRFDIQVDYRALGAAAYMGLGAVWALGLSSSAAQLQATPLSLPPEILAITGVLDFGKTIFTWQSMTLAVVLIVVTVFIAHRSAPQGNAIRTAADLGVDLVDEVEPSGGRQRPGEWFETSRVLPLIVGVIVVGWLIDKLATQPTLTVLSSLQGYLLVFMALGLVLHGTPRNFLRAAAKAVPTTTGVLVQFPFYAAMAAILTRAGSRWSDTRRPPR